MALPTIIRPDQFKLTLCRGDSLRIQRKVRLNVAPDNCSTVVAGGPVTLAGYQLGVSARVVGTGRVVPMTVALAVEGSSSIPAQFALQADPGALGFAFEEGALQTIDVRVQASRLGDTFTLLKGTIRMKDSATTVGTP